MRLSSLLDPVLQVLLTISQTLQTKSQLITLLHPPHPPRAFKCSYFCWMWCSLKTRRHSGILDKITTGRMRQILMNAKAPLMHFANLTAGSLGGHISDWHSWSLYNRNHMQSPSGEALNARKSIINRCLETMVCPAREKNVKKVQA